MLINHKDKNFVKPKNMGLFIAGARPLQWFNFIYSS